jgi:hypothetical protein
MTVQELNERLLTLEMLGGLHVRFTNTRADSVGFISALYRWWTDRDLDRHTSHLAVHDAPTFRAISDVAAALQKWPGVGIKVAQSAEKRFGGSIRRAATASAVTWAGVSYGQRNQHFGRTKADKLEAWLKGVKSEQ